MQPSYSFNPPLKGKPNLIIKGGLNDEILKAVDELDYNALIIKPGDWKDLSPLIKFKRKIKSLRLHTEELDWESLSSLIEIRSLEIGGNFNVGLEFAALKKLENLKTYWNKYHCDSIFDLKNLRCLSLHLWKQDNLTPFAGAKGLKFLELIDAKSLQSLEGLSGLKTLSGLRLHKAAKLADISAVSGLNNLKYLHFEGCKKINDYQPLNSLKKIIYFSNVHSANIASLSVLKGSNKIDTLILGNTKVEDDDFSIIDNLPNLKLILFKGSKSCAYKLKDVEKLLSEKWGAPMRQLVSEWSEIKDKENLVFA